MDLHFVTLSLAHYTSQERVRTRDGMVFLVPFAGLMLNHLQLVHPAGSASS